MSARSVTPTRGVILTYHALDDDGSALSTSPRLFDEHMRILAATGARVVTPAGLLAALDDPDPAGPLVLITFDDGLESVHRHGLPVLARHGWPAVVFLVTAYCGATNDWPGQGRWVRRQPLLGWGAAREMLAAGFVLGSHSCTHRDLTTLPPSEAEVELSASKRAIEDATGAVVEALAYPYGAYNPRLQLLARARFRCAFGTRLGLATARSDRFALDRVDAYYLRSPALLRQLFSWPVRGYLRGRQMGRDLRAWSLGWRRLSF